MNDICRLCCSTKFVSNNIFDEENALHLKMSLYLPIKIFRNDGLPDKVCDKCSCKVNDFYQFCNETIAVQARLRTLLMCNGFTTNGNVVDLTRVKECASPVEDRVCEQGTQTDWQDTHKHCEIEIADTHNTTDIKVEYDECDIEENLLSPVKEETYDDGGFSDNSDNISLFNLKKKKKTDRKENGVVAQEKTRDKSRTWEILTLPPMEVTPDSGKQDEQTKENQEAAVKTETQEEGEFLCCVCLNKFYSQDELLQHYKNHASEKSKMKPVLPPLPEKEPYRCIRCNKVVSAGEWAAHWARHWRLDTRAFRCGVCEKSFRGAGALLAHGLAHQREDAAPGARPRPFACEVCGAAFVLVRSLAAHRTRLHPELAARPLLLACAQCGRRFAHANSLRRHVRAHSGERNFLCNVCGKALSSREHLDFHLRIHAGDKRNVCGVCGKGFVKRNNLKLHERVHSGEKPHVCSHCGKTFTQRSSLVIHERYHSGARPYACALCGRGFVAKGLLTMHLKSTCI